MNSGFFVALTEVLSRRSMELRKRFQQGDSNITSRMALCSEFRSCESERIRRDCKAPIQMTETRNEHKVSVGMNKGKRALRIRNRIRIHKDNTNMEPERIAIRLPTDATVCVFISFIFTLHVSGSHKPIIRGVSSCFFLCTTIWFLCWTRDSNIIVTMFCRPCIST